MAQLQVPIPDRLMRAAKTYAAQNGTTLKVVVAAALENLMDLDLAKEEPAETPEAPKPETTQQEPPKDTYILRKTAKRGKALKEITSYNLGPVTWMLMDGSKPHYDKEGNIIPFRFTDEDGKDWEPSEDELKELSDYFGKPVTIES